MQRGTRLPSRGRPSWEMEEPRTGRDLGWRSSVCSPEAGFRVPATQAGAAGEARLHCISPVVPRAAAGQGSPRSQAGTRWQPGSVPKGRCPGRVGSRKRGQGRQHVVCLCSAALPGPRRSPRALGCCGGFQPSGSLSLLARVQCSRGSGGCGGDSTAEPQPSCLCLLQHGSTELGTRIPKRCFFTGPWLQRWLGTGARAPSDNSKALPPPGLEALEQLVAPCSRQTSICLLPPRTCSFSF